MVFLEMEAFSYPFIFPYYYKMRNTITFFHKLAEAGAFISLLCMILSVVIQVFARLFLPSAPNWTEEAARIFFIYMVAFGAGLGIRSDAFVKLDIIRNMIQAKYYIQLQIVICTAIMAFSGFLTYYGWQFTLLGWHEKSPALLVNMTVVFFSMPLMMLSLFLFTLEQLVYLIKIKNNPPA